VQPRALADAGAKFFGSWGAALAAAGIDPAPHVSRWRDIGTNSKPVLQLASDLVEVGLPPERRRGQRWTNEGVTNAILSRQRDRRAINAATVYRDDRSLYHAATRRHGNWRNALIAAGLDPSLFERYHRRP